MQSLKCPHCLNQIFVNYASHHLGRDADSNWQIQYALCPACKRQIIYLESGELGFVELSGGGHAFHKNSQWSLVHPKGYTRAPCSPEVPKHIAEDYAEACKVLQDSPKAAAALARRCLQTVLRENGGVKPGNLNDEIQQVLDGGRLPTNLAEAIDAVRNVGNFAAHPIKSKATGEIVPVEPHEAEWTIDVLETLFDFYFTQPAALKAKRDALNQKLAGAGKPPMK